MESVADDYKTLKEIGFTDETARYIINRYIIHDNHQDLEYWVNRYIEVFFREKLEKIITNNNNISTVSKRR